MDLKDEQHIERFLKAMPLRRPSDALDRRIADIEDAPPLRFGVSRWITAASAMAAMVLVGVIIGYWQPSDPASDPATQTAWMETTVETRNTIDDGLVWVGHNGAPVHQVRTINTTRVIVQEQDTQRTYEIMIPQQQVDYVEAQPF